MKLQFGSAFQLHTHQDSSWFRVFGFGFLWLDSKRRELFSERNGSIRYTYLGPVKFRLLAPQQWGANSGK